MSVPVLELDDVHVSRRGLPVLEGVSLRLEAQDYLALLGPNGGGKTTLLLALLGLIEPERGRIRVLGETPRRARGRVGYVPQRVSFDMDFPIRVIDVVQTGRLARLPLLRRYREADRAAAQVQLERLEIADLARRPIAALSGGQLQRVLIARALCLEPELLLLDEPTASLDERIGRGFWELLEELSHELTVIVVSHDIGAISRYVRSVACLNRRLFMHESGRLTEEMVEASYGCPVDLVAHGHPHRVLGPHPGVGGPNQGPSPHSGVGPNQGPGPHPGAQGEPER